MQYRRNLQPGATWFFTVVTCNRQPILCSPHAIKLLKQVFRHVRRRHPFRIEAIVVLPDHLHTIWTLPEGDANYALRWQLIKTAFTRRFRKGTNSGTGTPVWQSRYWEHTLRDANDFNRHVDYIHYNPVKHGHVEKAGEWPYSSVHKFIRDGNLPEDWGISPESLEGIGNE